MEESCNLVVMDRKLVSPLVTSYIMKKDIILTFLFFRFLCLQSSTGTRLLSGIHSLTQGLLGMGLQWIHILPPGHVSSHELSAGGW